MARVTRLENFYACRLLNVTNRLRIDDWSEPATGNSGPSYRHPGRFRARPAEQGELPVKGVNGKPVNVPGIRRARRIIAYSAFAVVRLTRTWWKSPRRNI